MPAIADLYKQKGDKAAAMRALNDKEGEWSGERQAQWEALNKEFDDLNALIETELASEKASRERAERLAEVEKNGSLDRGDRRIGLDHQDRRNSDPERQEHSRNEKRYIALQSWCMTRSRIDLRQEHKDVCREANFNPMADHLLIDAAGNVHARSKGDDTTLPEGSQLRRYGDPVWSCGGRVPQREVRVGLDVATSGAGQETIPRGFMAELDKKTLAYGNVRRVSRVVQTASGNSVPWPTVDDTGNEAAILAEATTIGTSVDPTFSSITLLAYKLSSKPVFVSAEIIQDSAFSLASELAEMIGIRFGRGETTYFTTGTNSSQPQGCVTAAGTGKTSAVAAAFTSDEILDLIHSLDPSYRDLPSTGFMFHDTALLYMRKFKDGNGQYLWQPGMQSGVPDRLANYPYSINQKMEPLVSGVPVTAKKHVLFGAFEKYIIRDAGGVRLYHLTERYRDVDQDCFVAFKRIDGRALNTAALKVLLQA